MADVEQIAGDLIAFTFRAEDRAFAVAKVRTATGGEFIAVGPLGHITEGQHLVLTGRWMHHDHFGRQFKVSSFLVEDPRTLRGLELYLSSGAVPGMGATIAKRIVAKFGLETLQILSTTPERLKEVEGIGPKRLERLLGQWQRDAVGREVNATLRGYGLGDALAQRIIETFGEETLRIITDQPYRLAAEVRGVGFRTADLIAQERGIAPDAPERAQAALIHLLREAASSEGHCYLPADLLVQQGATLSVPPEAAQDALHRLATLGQVALQDDVRVYLPNMERAESRLVHRLARLLRTPPPQAVADLPRVEAALGMDLSDSQRAFLEAQWRQFRSWWNSWRGRSG